MGILTHLRSSIREKIKEYTRSPLWGKVRDKFLEKNSRCAACGTDKNLQVHHINPFHLFPEQELDENNLITLCMDKNDCHLLIGHGDSWKHYNPNVKKDAAKYAASGSRIKRLIVENAKRNRLDSKDAS